MKTSPGRLFFYFVSSLVACFGAEETDAQRLDRLREIWRTLPESQKISSDEEAERLLPGIYSSGSSSTYFILPNHRYFVTVLMTPYDLWEEGEWRLSGGILQFRSTWRKAPTLRQWAPDLLPLKLTPHGEFSLSSWSPRFAAMLAESPEKAGPLTERLEQKIVAAEEPAWERRFQHLKLMIQACEKFGWMMGGDKNPPRVGGEKVLVFRPDASGSLTIFPAGIGGNAPSLSSNRVEIPYDLQTVRLEGPVSINRGRTSKVVEADLVYDVMEQRVTGKDFELRFRNLSPELPK